MSELQQVRNELAEIKQMIVALTLAMGALPKPQYGDKVGSLVNLAKTDRAAAIEESKRRFREKKG